MICNNKKSEFYLHFIFLFIITIIFPRHFCTPDAISVPIRHDYYIRLEKRAIPGDAYITAIAKTSLLQCATTCSRNENCRVFRWNSYHKFCLLGKRTSVNGVMTVVYSQQRKCLFELGYQMMGNGEHGRCLLFSKGLAPFDNARKLCISHEARLFKANSIELINMVLENRLKFSRDTNVEIWIGLDDIISEGNYVWSDGEEMTTSDKTLLFGSGQPSNVEGEDCAAINEALNGLNDVVCDASRFYICEIPLESY